MGCGGSTDKSPEALAQVQSNKAIEAELISRKKEMQRETKLLLLGAGESGKSTFAKQMKILHLNGFTKEDRIDYRRIIWANVLDGILYIIYGAQDLGEQFQDDEAAKWMLDHADYRVDEYPKFVDYVERLWKDPTTKKVLSQAEKFQMMENADLFVPRARDLAKSDYVPDDADILHSRLRTTGIVETFFAVGKLNFRMVDVGGQRSERKKWMHCFQDVTAIIFCVALSEYNLKLDEDRSQNRMQESLRLFRQIVNTKWFEKTDIILFLNKKDLFEKKIKTSPITECFPNYTGPQEFGAASKFIEEQFVAQREDKSKKVYPHITCATDTSNIVVVFQAIKDILLKETQEEMFGV